MTRFTSLLRAVLLTGVILAGTDMASAQRIDGRFTGVHEAGPQGEDLLRVRIELRAPDGAVDLGNATLMLSYNAEVVAFQSGAGENAQLTEAQDYLVYAPYTAPPELPAPYTSSVTVFGSPGRVAVNLVLNTLGSGHTIEDQFSSVVDVVFLVDQSGQEPELSWVLEPDPNPTVVYSSDNVTLVRNGEFNGQITSGVATEDEELPTVFELFPAYPNPFNPQAILSYAVPSAGRARLVIFDALGRRVATLIDEDMSAGRHQTLWDASAYASGIYFARLSSGQEIRTRSLILAK